MKFILSEIPTSILEMNPRAGLKTYELPRPTEKLEMSTYLSEELSRNIESLNDNSSHEVQEER